MKNKTKKLKIYIAAFILVCIALPKSNDESKLVTNTMVSNTIVSNTIVSNTIEVDTIQDETENEIMSEIAVQEEAVFDINTIPTYTNKAYVEVNGNIPYFTDEEMTTTVFETYSELDSLGRCGTAYANICKEIMPTEERGKIGEIKPTGWHLVKYDIVDGNYLYNRCHIIAYQLAGENANVKNLITGTRYLNETGMLPFEDRVAKYVNETDNHVLYRVIPIFSGDNLLSDGVLMEAKSVEDNGTGICFNVFCYNVQPGIMIDYATGDSTLDVIIVASENSADNQTLKSSTGTYAVNAKNGKIHIVGDCPATKGGDNAMKQPVYFDTYEEAQAYSISIASSQDKRNCGNCW